MPSFCPSKPLVRRRLCLGGDGANLACTRSISTSVAAPHETGNIDDEWDEDQLEEEAERVRQYHAEMYSAIKGKKRMRFELLHERLPLRPLRSIESAMARGLPERAESWYFEREEWEVVGSYPLEWGPRDTGGGVGDGHVHWVLESIPERPWLIGYAAFAWMVEIKRSAANDHLGQWASSDRLDAPSPAYTLSDEDWSLIGLYNYEPRTDCFVVFNLAPDFASAQAEEARHVVDRFDVSMETMKQAQAAFEREHPHIPHMPEKLEPRYFTPEREDLQRIAQYQGAMIGRPIG